MPTYKNETDDIIYDVWQPIEPGDTYETIRNLDDTDLTKLSEDPYYPLADREQTVSFGGAGTQQAGVSLNSKVLRVSTDVEVTIKANSSSNPYTYTMYANEERDIYNDHSIKVLEFTTSGAGDIHVVELKDNYTISKKF